LAVLPLQHFVFLFLYAIYMRTTPLHPNVFIDIIYVCMYVCICVQYMYVRMYVVYVCCKVCMYVCMYVCWMDGWMDGYEYIGSSPLA
jgi:hypothetical protein